MSKRRAHFYEFDSFRLDPEELVLFRDGRPVQLSPKLLETLLVLVRNSGHIVEKDRLIHEVWRDTYVEENNLSQYISTLRKVLGDGRREQRYIETVPRRGYRFTAETREVFNDGDLIRTDHSSVRLVVKEEIEEIEDSNAQAIDLPVTTPAHRAIRLWIISGVVIAVVAGLISYRFMNRPRAADEARPSLVSPGTISVTSFGPLSWPRSDTELGIAGFTIEDFEDSKLVDGLQIELSDSNNNFVPVGTLPVTFNPAIDDPNSDQIFIPGVWDGSRVLINRRNLPPHGYRDFGWGDITFHVRGGATSFGFSLDDMDLDTELFVNGASKGNLRKLLPSNIGRNGYLRIDGSAKEPIFSVKVANGNSSNTGDALMFDHVAFKPLQQAR